MNINIKDILDRNSILKASLINPLGLNICIVGSEKYNADEPHDKPKEDGSFDIEGHCWTDIHSWCGPYWWNPFDWFEIAKNILSEIYNSIRYLKKFNYTHTFWGWCFTVESLNRCIKSDYIEELASKNVGLDKFHDSEEGKDVNFMNPTEGYNKIMKEYSNEINRLSLTNILKDDIIKYLENDHTQINSFLWVSDNDPTVIVIDEDKFNFDLKDGWSDIKIKAIIKLWLNEFDYSTQVNLWESKDGYLRFQDKKVKWF